MSTFNFAGITVKQLAAAVAEGDCTAEAAIAHCDEKLARPNMGNGMRKRWTRVRDQLAEGGRIDVKTAFNPNAGQPKAEAPVAPAATLAGTGNGVTKGEATRIVNGLQRMDASQLADALAQLAR